MRPTRELENPIANRMRQGRYPLAGLGARLVVAAASVRARTWLRPPIQRVAHIAPRGLLLIAPTRGSAGRLDAEPSACYEAAREPKELMVVEGAAHSEARTPSAARSTSAACWSSLAGTWTG